MIPPRYSLHKRGRLIWEGVVRVDQDEGDVEVKVCLTRIQHVYGLDVWIRRKTLHGGFDFFVVPPDDMLAEVAGLAAFSALHRASSQIQAVVSRSPQLPGDV